MRIKEKIEKNENRTYNEAIIGEISTIFSIIYCNISYSLAYINKKTYYELRCFSRT
jgi:hypothetical protein